MAATNVIADLYIGKSKVFEMTVRDKADAIVDLSPIASPSDDIHWIMQKAADDTTDHVYKSLGGGITFKTDGTDGVVKVELLPADTAAILAALEEDLSYFAQLSVELSNQPYITAEGTMTIKASMVKVVDIDEAGEVGDSASEVTPGTFQSDDNLDAPGSADSGSSSEAGVLTTTVGT